MNRSEPRHGALHGIRVIDLSTSISGAWCGKMLSDFGASVALIEGPEGHPARQIAPFDKDSNSVVASYVLANRRSAVVDMSEAEGIGIVQAAIERADVLVCNVTPEELTKMGLDLEPLLEKTDGLIVCCITPHGYTGARSAQPGNNLTASALSGWASINGLADRPPLKASGFQASYCAGTMAYSSIVSALLHRQKHDPHWGQFIDISELEVMTSTFGPALLAGQYEGKPPGRVEKVDMSTGPVPVKDGHFALTISRPHFWRDAMNVLGLGDLAEDPRWGTRWYRQQHAEEYVYRAQEKLSAWNKMDLFDALAALRVIAGPVLETNELVENAHLRDREFFQLPENRRPDFPGPAFKMSQSPAEISRHAPEPGADTAHVLSEFAGLREISIKSLMKSGAAR
ncbi:MAG: CoA transferase [Dehalococcoidia bacterium]